MSKIRVGVIFGGRSTEHEVSLQSAKNIINGLDRNKFDVCLFQSRFDNFVAAKDLLSK